MLVEASQSHGAIEEQGQRCEVSKDSSSQHRCAKETDRVETRSSTSHTTGSEPFVEMLKTLTIRDRCYSSTFSVSVLSLVLS